MNNTPYMVFAGTKSRYLAEEICKELGCELGQMNTTYFADGEFAVSYEVYPWKECIPGTIYIPQFGQPYGVAVDG